MVSFEITYSIVERPLEGSTSNEGTSCLRSCEEVLSNGIFEIIRDKEFINKEEPTSGRILEKYSSNEEDEVF